MATPVAAINIEGIFLCVLLNIDHELGFSFLGKPLAEVVVEERGTSEVLGGEDAKLNSRDGGLGNADGARNII